MSYSKKAEEEEEGLENLFNGSIDTLNRINELIKHISAYRVNGHWIGMKENLGELLVEAQGCLSKEEYKKGWKDFLEIDQYPITVNDEGLLVYDEELPIKLKKFNQWLRLKLYKHKLTMAKGWGGYDKLQLLRKRYGLA